MNDLATQDTLLPAMVGSKIATIPPMDIENRLLQILIRANQILGYKADPGDMAFMCGELQSLLSERYKLITLEDVEKAVVNGACGLYDSEKSVSVRTVSTWIRLYQNSKIPVEEAKPNDPCHVIAGSILSQLCERSPAFRQALEDAGKTKWKRF